jgi:hypothetical protein
MSELGSVCLASMVFLALWENCAGKAGMGNFGIQTKSGKKQDANTFSHTAPFTRPQERRIGIHMIERLCCMP